MHIQTQCFKLYDGSVHSRCSFDVCRAQYEESIGSEDVISLSDIVPNASKCSVSFSVLFQFFFSSFT